MPALSEIVKRQIGQHFVFGFHGHELNDDMKTLIHEYHVGCFILMKRNVRDAFQVRRLIWDLQAFAKKCGHEQPLLIGTDQENGMVSAFSSPSAGTQFPGAMSIAATGSVELAGEINLAIGKELASVGINWAYSPVADVNSDPRNPVIGVRSFGDDPNVVGEFACAVSKGLDGASVAACAKHFPGHGDTHVDSHLALPVIQKSIEDLETLELVPFKALISPSSSVATIMTGHMSLPALTGDMVPASLNRAVTTDLLRAKMGYNGVVVTDCLEMEAVAALEGGSEKAAVESLKAGADIAMICHTLGRQTGAVKRTWDAYAAGEFEGEELQDSGRRITALKARYAGSWEAALPAVDGITTQEDAFKKQWSAMSENHKKLSVEAYKKSIYVEKRDALPLARGRPVLLCTPETESLNRAIDDAEELLRSEKGSISNTAGSSFLSFAASMGQRTKVTHIVYTQKPDNSPVLNDELKLASFDAVVIVLRNAQRSKWQVENLMAVASRAAFEARSMKIVVMSSCEPYDALELAAGSQLYGAGLKVGFLASFEFTAPALDAAAGIIFGETRADGVMPVTRVKHRGAKHG
ncbi:hypothetical protein HGRIS_002445 [Hohenbuehelia grisea]|uniref:Glycoside hydrolase family 3 N-terminal domain-containing protein n=1 Tax=Hohenbuehelia grisea TaxID=104357 RepID=A0ABR3JL82_9AGAR